MCIVHTLRSLKFTSSELAFRSEHPVREVSKVFKPILAGTEEPLAVHYS